MSNHRLRRAGLSALAATLGVIGIASVAGAAGTVSGPSVSVDQTDVNPGDHISVTIDGFTAPSVTVALCGNNARRGSSDCNMILSKGVRIDPAISPTVTQLIASEPPADCPCVIRVSSPDNVEVSAAPITLIGHPVGPIVAGPDLNDPLVALTITATPKPHGLFGWIRSDLGGPANYDVTVTVKNITTERVTQVKLFASVGRDAADELATLSFDEPGEIGPGQTWKQTVSTTVPAPSFGSVQWRVASTRAGPTVTATSTTNHRPVLLVILVMVLVADIALLVIRAVIRRRARREAGRAVETAASDTAPGEEPADREPVLILT